MTKQKLWVVALDAPGQGWQTTVRADTAEEAKQIAWNATPGSHAPDVVYEVDEGWVIRQELVALQEAHLQKIEAITMRYNEELAKSITQHGREIVRVLMKQLEK